MVTFKLFAVSRNLPPCDTDKYFAIGADPIGGGTSSSPKDGLGIAFPKYTIRDRCAPSTR